MLEKKELDRGCTFTEHGTLQQYAFTRSLCTDTAFFLNHLPYP